MTVFACAVINCLVIFVAKKMNKDFFHPVRLLNLMWLVVHCMNLLLGWQLNEPVYLILALPSIMFSVGFFIAEKFRIKGHKSKEMYFDSNGTDADVLYRMRPLVVNIVFLFVCVIFVFYLYSFISRLGSYSGLSSWLAFRQITWEENINEKVIFKYSTTLAFLLPSVLIVNAQQSKRRSDWLKFFISIAIAVVWSYVRTSRTSTFVVVIILALSQIELMDKGNSLKFRYADRKKSKKKRRRVFAVTVIFMLVLFLYVALRKNGDIYGGVSLLEFYLRSISNYTNLSSAAFVEWYKEGFTYSHGANTFRIFIAVLGRLGLSNTVAASNSGGLFVEYAGMTTNALTVARAYIEDFGVVYMSIILMVFGVIHGSVHKQIKKSQGLRRIRFALLNGMLGIPLFFQIMTNQYTNVLSGWIQYTLLIILFTSPSLWFTKQRRES